MGITVFKKLKAIWELTRLEHGIIYAFSVVLSMIIAYKGFPDPVIALAGSLAAIFAEMGAFALNDYYDVEVDIKNNRTDRPIVRGEVTKREALWITIVSFILSIISVIFMQSIGAFIVLIALIVFGIFYDMKLKEYGIWGNIYISFTMAAPFLFGSMIFISMDPSSAVTLVIISVIAFVVGLGREIMKGIMDVEGDALRDVKTVARVYGEDKAKYVAVALYTLGMILGIIPFVINIDPQFYLNMAYGVFALAALCILSWICLRLLKSHDVKTIGKMRKVTLLAMLVAIIGFLAGALIRLP